MLPALLVVAHAWLLAVASAVPSEQTWRGKAREQPDEAARRGLEEQYVIRVLRPGMEGAGCNLNETEELPRWGASWGECPAECVPTVELLDSPRSVRWRARTPAPSCLLTAPRVPRRLPDQGECQAECEEGKTPKGRYICDRGTIERRSTCRIKVTFENLELIHFIIFGLVCFGCPGGCYLCGRQQGIWGPKSRAMDVPQTRSSAMPASSQPKRRTGSPSSPSSPSRVENPMRKADVGAL